tara:strand:- start:841 stop:1050 length:210 start_codon:yes stop_codon:yes gene_type:complete
MPTKEEVIDKFDTYHSFNLISLLTDIKDNLKQNGIPILDKNLNTDSTEFVDLFTYSIAYKEFYKKSKKI